MPGAETMPEYTILIEDDAKPVNVKNHIQPDRFKAPHKFFPLGRCLRLSGGRWDSGKMSFSMKKTDGKFQLRETQVSRTAHSEPSGLIVGNLSSRHTKWDTTIDTFINP